MARKRTLLLTVVVVLLALLRVPCSLADENGENNEDFEDDQLVVGLAQGASIDVVNAHYGTFTLDHRPGTVDYLLGTSEGADLDALLLSMSLDPEIIYSELNGTAETAEGTQGTIASVDRNATSATFHSQPSFTVLRGAPAHARATGRGVVVAVVDNGVSPEHGLLAGHLSSMGFDFVEGDWAPWETANGLDDDGDGSVDEGFGHGTHVSGLVLLAAPDAILLPVRVLDDEGRGPAYRVALGIRYAARAGASIINLSLALPRGSNLVAQAIEEAEESGVTVVAGAGNGGAPAVDFPANVPDVIATAATDEMGVRMPISNFGASIVISAPGQNVLSAFGSADYARWGGTSMAAPFASGGAALLRERYPMLGSRQIASKMRQTATSIVIQNPGYESLLGGGLVNLEGLATVSAPDASSLRVREQAGTIVFWEPVEGATSYDLIRGEVSRLTEGSQGVSLGPVVCIANDITTTHNAAAPDLTRPAPGRAFFYLMRPSGGSVPSDYSEGSDERVPGPGDCAKNGSSGSDDDPAR